MPTRREQRLKTGRYDPMKDETLVKTSTDKDPIAEKAQKKYLYEEGQRRNTPGMKEGGMVGRSYRGYGAARCN